MLQTDFLVIGSGIAGLSFGLKASRYGKVVIITKDKLEESNTLYAQGGLAGVFSKDDSFEKHIANTLRAGDGLCNKKAVEIVVRNAPKEILWLEKEGVKFDKNGSFKLTKEAVHSDARIVHAGDITGEEIERSLIKKVNSNKKIIVLEFNQAIKLITKNGRCHGALVLDEKKECIYQIIAKSTVLATGGLGQIYSNTCNPAVATGDGFSLAYQAGASLQDMEFMQFHPTGLYKTNFLISETLRGEGGHLKNKFGEIYMPKYHRDGELAPRDVVSKFTIDEMKRTKRKHVFLDITHLGSEYIKKRFPKIYKKCLSYGIDITKDYIPVTPTAHYSCGGVKIDLKGRTTIKCLYALGEVSCSGLHGADRLASNSLTEGLVFGSKLIGYLAKVKNNSAVKLGQEKINIRKTATTKHLKEKIKKIMWEKVGIIRNKKMLKSALKDFSVIDAELRNITKKGINREVVELVNMLVCAKVITRCALARKESRGTHFIEDYPKRDDKRWKKHSVIDKKGIMFE